MRHFLLGLTVAATIAALPGCQPAPTPVNTRYDEALSFAAGPLKGRVILPADLASDPATAVAQVVLADAAGQAVPNIAAVTTDAAGRFTFEGVPSAFNFQVVATVKTTQGREVRLAAIARSDLYPVQPVDIDGPATLLTTALTEQRSGPLHDLDMAAYARALDETRLRLTREGHPDWTDRAAVAARFRTLASSFGAIEGPFRQLEQSLTTMEAHRAKRDLDLQTQLQAIQRPAGAQVPMIGSSSK